MNPETVVQTVTVTLLREAGKAQIVTSIPIEPRGRVPVALHWQVSDEAFGVEVVCAPHLLCAPALVMWDKDFRLAHESISVARTCR